MHSLSGLNFFTCQRYRFFKANAVYLNMYLQGIRSPLTGGHYAHFKKWNNALYYSIYVCGLFNTIMCYEWDGIKRIFCSTALIHKNVPNCSMSIYHCFMSLFV